MQFSNPAVINSDILISI